MRFHVLYSIIPFWLLQKWLHLWQLLLNYFVLLHFHFFLLLIFYEVFFNLINCILVLINFLCLAGINFINSYLLQLTLFFIKLFELFTFLLSCQSMLQHVCRRKDLRCVKDYLLVFTFSRSYIVLSLKIVRYFDFIRWLGLTILR